jgi:hypothetical protein
VQIAVKRAPLIIKTANTILERQPANPQSSLRRCSLQTILLLRGLLRVLFEAKTALRFSSTIPLISEALGHAFTVKSDQYQQRPQSPLRQLLVFQRQIYPGMLETVKGLESVRNGF